jgi:hypothetical protein
VSSIGTSGVVSRLVADGDGENSVRVLVSADGSAAEGTSAEGSGSVEGSGLSLGGVAGVCSLTGSVGFNQGRADCSEGATSISIGSELLASGVDVLRASDVISSSGIVSDGVMSGVLVSRGSDGNGGVSGTVLVKLSLLSVTDVSGMAVSGNSVGKGGNSGAVLVSSFSRLEEFGEFGNDNVGGAGFVGTIPILGSGGEMVGACVSDGVDGMSGASVKG